MSVYVIGIDGLDYSLVKELDLKNLKQKEFGEVTVPIDEEVGHPVSPTVWATFLTGERSDKEFEFDSKVRGFLTKLKKKFNVPDIPYITSRPPLFGKLFTKDRGFPSLERKTFLDEVESTVVNVPYYDYSFVEDHPFFINPDMVAKDFKEFFDKRMEEFKTGLKKMEETSNPLSMIYFNLDMIQHRFFMDMEYIRDLYMEVDEILGNTRLNEEFLVMTISDHGFDFEEGTHSNYAFYSANKELELEDPHITDFYDIIMGKLNLPTSEDKEKMRKKLKELGYI